MALVVKASTLNRKKIGDEQEWLDHPGGGTFLVRGMGHRIVQIGIQADREEQQQAYALYRAGDATALESARTLMEINIGVLAGLVLGDWKDVILEDGSALEYTPESAAAILTDEENTDLVNWLVVEATRISKEASEKIGAIMGKSSTASSGRKKPAASKSAAKASTSNQPQSEAQ